MVGEGEEVDDQDAGKEVHFSRVVSAGGASSYRLNDKEVRCVNSVDVCTWVVGLCRVQFVWRSRRCWSDSTSIG